MEYIEIKDNIIIGCYCGEMPKGDDGIARVVVETPMAYVGEDARVYADLRRGVKKPLHQLVDESLVSVPKGEKLNADGTAFEEMTAAEKWEAGLLVLQPNQWLDDGADYAREKTEKEKLAAGLITGDEYNAHISNLRKNAYSQEVDPLFFQYQRGESNQETWLNKVQEIKNRYPKVAVDEK